VVRVAIIAAVVLLLGGAGATAWGVRYTRDGRRLCGATCHTDQAQANKARHAKVDCLRCHSAAPASRWRLLWSAVLGGRTSAPPHGQTAKRACADCHNEASDERWKSITANEGHRAHLARPESGSCNACHAAGEHQPARATASCRSCHKKAGSHRKQVAGDADGCVACHEFRTRAKDEKQAASTAEVCGRCHGTADKKAAGKAPRIAGKGTAHGTVDCKGCHNPHDKDAKPPACASCHKDIKADGSERVREGHDECDGCHEPHLAAKAATGACQTCHEQAETPAADAKPTTASKHDECFDCHQPHTWTPSNDICAECHTDRADKLKAMSPAGHTCIGCHNPHKPLPGPAKCISCHPQRASHPATAPGGHQLCTGCHNPHAVKSGVSCARCHSDKQKLLNTSGLARHKAIGCRGCHTPHNNPLPSLATCARCHGDKVSRVRTAPPAPHKRCASCHQPHTFKISSSVAACSRCHGELARSRTAHKGECKSCHTPHGSPAIPTARCAKCHSKQGASVGKRGHHSQCKTCHRPHLAAATASTQCGSCHSDKAQVAKSWPAGSPHREQCSRCHKPHSGSGPPACGSCHRDKAAQAAGGKMHCTQCHYPHKRPASGGGTPYWSRCAGCHKAEQAAASRRGRTHRRCANCHKPHAFKKPACVSCHKNRRKVAGHAIPQHARCTNCHGSHSRGALDRRTCVRCHKDRKDHQPAAPRCQGCHPFK